MQQTTPAEWSSSLEQTNQDSAAQSMQGASRKWSNEYWDGHIPEIAEYGESDVYSDDELRWWARCRSGV